MSRFSWPKTEKTCLQMTERSFPKAVGSGFGLPPQFRHSDRRT